MEVRPRLLSQKATDEVNKLDGEILRRMFGPINNDYGSRIRTNIEIKELFKEPNL